MSTNDGATPERKDLATSGEQTKPECMGRWKHSKSWVWKGDTWTDFRRCNTCGKLFDKEGREVQES